MTSCADGSALKAAINARSHPRSLSQCDREEYDDDDRHDLEGPTITGCVAADNRKSMRLFCTRLPYMIDGRCLSNDKSLSSSFQEDGSRHVLYTVYSRAYSISTLYNGIQRTHTVPRSCMVYSTVYRIQRYTVYSHTAVYSIQRIHPPSAENWADFFTKPLFPAWKFFKMRAAIMNERWQKRLEHKKA